MGKCMSKTEEPVLNPVSRIDISQKQLVKIKKANIRQDYIIENKISDGQFGNVYEATCKLTKEKRAVKFMPIDDSQSSSVKSLCREVDVLRELDHFNIIKIVDIYLENKFLNIVTELCVGGNIIERIVEKTIFSENKAAEYAMQINSALVYIHEKGIVYRNLCPETVMFEDRSDNACLKLVSFGKSKSYNKAIKTLTKSKYSLYMAPEIISGEVNAKSDVWSLGMLLYVMLSGTKPFEDCKDDEMMINIATQKIQFDGKPWKRISPQAIDLVGQMLEIDHKKRISAKDVRNHPWIKTYTSNDAEHKRISKINIRNLSKIVETSKFKRAIQTFMLQKLTFSNEVTKLNAIFREIDENGDGVLNMQEIKNGFDKANILVDNIDEILSKIDFNENGTVSYSEFLSSFVDWGKELSREKLQSAFNCFDKNGDGMISESELFEIFGSQGMPADHFKEFIKEADLNNDGFIDFNEFCQFMNQDKIINHP